MFTLSLFLHETNECLINQPSANYCLVEINNPIKKDFRKAMVNSITNLTEEIYISIYEIGKTSNPLTTKEYPKIYPTCCLMEEEYEPASIPGFYAIIPTEQGLKLLISACEFKGKGNYSSDNLSIFASQIFSDIAEHQRDMMSKVFSEVYQSFIIINMKDTGNIVQDFKQDIQSELQS